MSFIRAGVFLALTTPIHAQTLELPERSATAPSGTEFARAVENMPQEERERRVLAEIAAGNVPSFLRTLVPVTVTSGTDSATFYVAPDYLAIGSDGDFLLIPMTPRTAQAIADKLGCTLPTRKMVNDIYKSSEVKLAPAPIPPSPAMTTIPVFVRHNEMVLAQWKEKHRPPRGALIAGHKKDVVIANQMFRSSGKVAIYGWHRLDGTPIQPLYTGHVDTWADYSHGIRLVQRSVTVNGQAKPIDEVLADDRLAPLLSDEGVMRQSRYPTGATPAASQSKPPVAPPGEAYDVLQLDAGVRVVINRPELRPSNPVLLVFYALPNGNTIEQTIGKALKPGDDWHFDIQHIAAQTRFLREKLSDRTIVVAYLENDLKAWPAWRRKNGDAGIPKILDAVSARFKGPGTRIVLNGHSGGGSLIFGYLNCLATIPDHVERIAFLDSNYAYETEKHKEKLASWLKASDAHYLLVLAYNDAVALLNGKSFVSAKGGTWGRSQQMISDLQPTFPLMKTENHGITQLRALDGRLEFFLKENPNREIFHTVQVERNGFIESMLSGTPLEWSGYTYFGRRAYTQYISAD